MGFKWLKDFVEEIFVGFRYFDSEFGEFFIKVFRLMDLIDEGVLDIVFLRFIFVDSFGKLMTVDFNDVVVDGGLL